ncbi:MAG TPA: glycosyltransferase family 4 protein [Thermoanaerobaculia bacterium]|nr:glycosyltransferase family 4 protein [Thermoanaerobaculia bacterium]
MRPVVYGVLPRPPHPTRDGLAIRNFHLLTALAERFEVRAFTLVDPDRAYGGGVAPPGVEIERIPQRARRTRRAGAAARSLVSRRPYSELLYRSAPLERRLAEACAERTPAWIVAHSYHVAPAALSAGPPVWIDFHNLDSEIWRRVGAAGTMGPRRAFVRVQEPRLRRLEASLARQSAGISCVSDRDREAIARLAPGPEPVVVPNGVDLSRYVFRSRPPASERILFVGDLSWPPNADAVRWFARNVWPLVRERRPGTSVEIVGRDAPPELLAFADGRFAFAGESDDTRPHWEAAAVAIVPLRVGGGTRLKILEAAACGVPVVSTRIGAEGLDFADEKELRLGDEPADFAGAVVALLSDPEAARRQASAARSRVEERYDWRRIGAEFAEILAARAAARP